MILVRSVTAMCLWCDVVYCEVWRIKKVTIKARHCDVLLSLVRFDKLMYGEVK